MKGGGRERGKAIARAALINNNKTQLHFYSTFHARQEDVPLSVIHSLTHTQSGSDTEFLQTISATEDLSVVHCSKDFKTLHWKLAMLSFPHGFTYNYSLLVDCFAVTKKYQGSGFWRL